MAGIWGPGWPSWTIFSEFFSQENIPRNFPILAPHKFRVLCVLRGFAVAWDLGLGWAWPDQDPDQDQDQYPRIW